MLKLIEPSSLPPFFLFILFFFNLVIYRNSIELQMNIASLFAAIVEAYHLRLPLYNLEIRFLSLSTVQRSSLSWHDSPGCNERAGR